MGRKRREHNGGLEEYEMTNGHSAHLSVHGDRASCAGKWSVECSPSTTSQHGRINVPQPRSILCVDSIDCTPCDYISSINEWTWEIRSLWLEELGELIPAALCRLSNIRCATFLSRDHLIESLSPTAFTHRLAAPARNTGETYVHRGHPCL